MQNWTDLKQPPPPLKPDVYVSWVKTYPQEHSLNHNTVFRNLTINHILFLSALHPLIPFLTLSSDTATQQYPITDITQTIYYHSKTIFLLKNYTLSAANLTAHMGDRCYTPMMAFGKLLTTPGVRCMKHASS